MGANEQHQPHDDSDRLLSKDGSGEVDEENLLDAVLRETMGNSNQAALDLIFDVARKSEYADTSHIEAVEELVRAIMKRSFGTRKFSRRLIHRIACSLVEAPEATVRIERLWQEARSSG